ncbi:MAG: aminotransferase class III-fold pyridoxal phosphate-dependent enzyme, partial [Paracoccaceae bacterium]|nr:aminotransferase class III-fold pyridoxal phosphate-dependent enzyme [Paracoccaceae bacterium]
MSRRLHTEGEANTSAARADYARSHAHPAEANMLRRDAAAFLHQSLSSPCVATIAKAEGIWIEDLAGRRYMDFHGNSVHHIGYGHPRLIAAIKDQLDQLSFAPRRFTCEPAVALAEDLGRRAPGTLDKVLFTTGGSDAVEVALKLARAATGRFKTISFWDAFHGAGFGSSSVGGEATFRAGIAGPLMTGAEHVAPWAPRDCPYGTESLAASARACARMIDYVLGRDSDYAAFIAEPMRATPLVPAPGFWRAVREACDRHGTLLIFDEIPTGLGKTGRFFSHEHDGVTPDILVLGKALGGGVLPIASVIARHDLDVAGDYA